MKKIFFLGTILLFISSCSSPSAYYYNMSDDYYEGGKTLFVNGNSIELRASYSYATLGGRIVEKGLWSSLQGNDFFETQNKFYNCVGEFVEIVKPDSVKKGYSYYKAKLKKCNEMVFYYNNVKDMYVRELKNDDGSFSREIYRRNKKYDSAETEI
jgi:hypothetical protein